MATNQADSCSPSSADPVERAVDTVRQFSRSLWLDLVRRDQSDRWLSGSGVPAERYFELLPELHSDFEARDDSSDKRLSVAGLRDVAPY